MRRLVIACTVVFAGALLFMLATASWSSWQYQLILTCSALVGIASYLELPRRP